MTYKLFIDDERYPFQNDFIIVRSYDEAVDYITINGIPVYISFDHDLGTEKTGMDILKWLCNYSLDNDISLNNMGFYVHSQNPIGRDNLYGYFQSFLKNSA